jgi:hypothetical protein
MVTVEVKDNTKAVEQLLKDLSKLAVYVGIPEENTGRTESEVSNVELAYIHSNGSPLQGIPARPFIEPSIEEEATKEAIAKELSQASKSALDGNEDQAVTHLNRAGMIGSNAAKNWIGSEHLTPLKPATIARKGSDKPLIDTGQLRNAITYVVREE